MNESSDHQLILRAQRGDRQAFEGLVQRYDRKVLAIALSFTRNSEDAKDVYQEVFMRVHRALPDFQFRAKFSTWLHRVTTNVCLTYTSRSKAHLYDSLDEGRAGPDSPTLGDTLESSDRTEERLFRSEISHQVRNAMHRLSPQQRMVFTLRHMRGHKLREIAEIMNCAEGTVKKYLFTANQRLRDELRPLYSDVSR
ncbi:MAG TPA: sigma-70 family RNA polymerase sigma factor [Acidobacteriota bacterium]|nr:sigma-70 family RNA polymerase sigma factor [Acidobacteriota bacterium]